MWRLTKEALREGVKSTTRYRSKQPNKRGNRTHHPQPQRQASGAKGGVAARRSANVRRSKRVLDHYRSSPYAARSVPSAFEPTYHHNHDMPYPPSPYYGSDIEYVYNHSKPDFGNPTHGLDLFPQSQAFPTNMMNVGDSAYVLAQSLSEPLFTDSPTPSAEEPRTPMSAGFGEMDLGQQGWEGNEMGLEYQEYAG